MCCLGPLGRWTLDAALGAGGRVPRGSACHSLPVVCRGISVFSPSLPCSVSLSLTPRVGGGCGVGLYDLERDPQALRSVLRSGRKWCLPPRSTLRLTPLSLPLSLAQPTHHRHRQSPAHPPLSPSLIHSRTHLFGVV